MVYCHTYTTAGHSPRSSKHSAFSDHVDIVYNVYKEPEGGESSVPRAQKLNFLLLHGSQLTKEVWNYHVELLFKHYGPRLDRVIAVDALNSGDSAWINRGRIGWYHAWEDLARDHVNVVRDVVRREGLPGPLFAMGHSMGGTETLFLASHAPALFAGVIVMDPVWGPDNIFNFSESGRVVAKIMSGVLKRSPSEFESQDAYNEFMDKKYLSATFHPRIKEDVRKHSAVESNGKLYMKTTPEQQAGAYGGCLTLSIHSTTTFAYCPVPALVAYGEDEDWNPTGSNDTLAEMLPQGETAVIKNGGHVVFFQQPEASLEAIYPFVEKVSAKWFKEKDGGISTDREDTKGTFKEWVARLGKGPNRL